VRFFSVALLIAILAGSAADSEAERITLHFSGIITDGGGFNGETIEGRYELGDPYVMFYSFESTTPDENPDSTQGWYLYPSLDAQFRFGTQVLDLPIQLNPQGSQGIVLVGNDRGASGSDFIQIAYNDVGGEVVSPPPVLNGSLIDRAGFQLDLIEVSGTLLDDDSLPIAPLNLEQFAFSKAEVRLMVYTS
jgi:hypothetical protein